MFFSAGLPHPFLLHTVIDLLMTRHVRATAHRVPAVSTNERSLQKIKVLARSNVLLVLPRCLALVLKEVEKLRAMMGGIWIDNSLPFSSTVVACIPEDSKQ
jgi:hypothetical protein